MADRAERQPFRAVRPGERTGAPPRIPPYPDILAPKEPRKPGRGKKWLGGVLATAVLAGGGALGVRAMQTEPGVKPTPTVGPSTPGPETPPVTPTVNPTETVSPTPTETPRPEDTIQPPEQIKPTGQVKKRDGTNYRLGEIIDLRRDLEGYYSYTEIPVLVMDFDKTTVQWGNKKRTVNYMKIAVQDPNHNTFFVNVLLGRDDDDFYKGDFFAPNGWGTGTIEHRYTTVKEFIEAVGPRVQSGIELVLPLFENFGPKVYENCDQHPKACAYYRAGEKYTDTNTQLINILNGTKSYSTLESDQFAWVSGANVPLY